MSAMGCANHCGTLYERDGKWWCLNNYCEHSYFWEKPKQPTLDTVMADIHLRRAEILEEFSRAYLADNPGVAIGDVQLVQQMEPDGLIFRWWFEKRKVNTAEYRHP